MKIRELTDKLEEIAPLAHQESYDNSGLLVGDPEKEVKAALICLDCTEGVVDEAIRKKCDLIISHHPLIFDGLKRLTESTYVERAVVMAIRNDIAIYSIHTNLDNVIQGVNGKIGEILNLQNCEVLAPKSGLMRKLHTFCSADSADAVRNALFKAGGGRIGDYEQCSFNTEGYGTFQGGGESNPHIGKAGKLNKEEEIRIEVIYPVQCHNQIMQALFESHPYEEIAYDIVPLLNNNKAVGAGMVGELVKRVSEEKFLNELKEKMHVSCLRHSSFLDKKIKRIAVCGGSGSFLLSQAINARADVFITADIKYHQFFDAENKIVIVDIGHYESEQFTRDLIMEMLKQKFPTFALHLCEANTNPISYL